MALPAQAARPQGGHMEEDRWSVLGKGVALAVGYCAVFLGLWHLSFNQWYLPAGLRLACLLLLPLRYWPYVFAGDAAALLVMRVPKAEAYSYQWAYLSPLLLISMIALVPWCFRRKLETPNGIVRWFPAIAAVAAVWSCACAMFLNYALHGPRQLVNLQNVVSYSVGNFLGMLMVVLPCLLWAKRKGWPAGRRDILQDLGIASAMIAALYWAAMLPAAQDAPIQLMPLIFMLLPAVYLAVVHGWHGAACGLLLVNVAIALALPDTQALGAYDGIVLIAQIALCVAAAALLAVGDRVSSLFAASSAALMAEYEALQALRQRDAAEEEMRSGLRATLHATQLRLRERALFLAQARSPLDTYRLALADALKQDRQPQRAMEVMRVGLEAARALEEQTEHLYPFEIETYGLYAALGGVAFLDVWERRARVLQHLLGASPRCLSMPLRVGVYRACWRAFELLAEAEPSMYKLRVRTFRRRGRCGVLVRVRCTPSRQPPQEALAQQAQAELDVWVRAYGGVVKRAGMHEMRFLMWESEQP
jgi:hypothetical protein